MVDALASGASVLRDVEVRVFSRVPRRVGPYDGAFFVAGKTKRNTVSRPVVAHL